MAPPADSAVLPVTSDQSEADDPRVLEVVRDYQTEWECGRRPDREWYLMRHPELVPVIAGYFDGIDLLYREMTDLNRSGDRRHDTDLVPGDRVGEFEIVREVGRGGMGVVYEAAQPSLNRRVAIKVLPGASATDSLRLRRFTIEARAAAAVAHPNIVPVYAVGEDRGLHYYVMRLVDGASLDSVIHLIRHAPTGPVPAGPPAPRRTGGPGLPPDQLIDQYLRDRSAHHRTVARIGTIIARALDHAHQSGVVHRDIKPANILLGRDGHVWVTDFGLARFMGAANGTRTGAPIGTFRYMSPEQASGDKCRLDHRTDVYSLTVTLYELLTGRQAFPSNEPATVLRQITHDDPPAPRVADPTVPADLETILLKGLEKEPQDRYTTAADLADDLDRFLTGRPIRAHRPGPWARPKKWTGRHPVATACAIVCLLLLFAASGVITALTRHAYQAERARADEADRRFQQSKKLGDLMVRISEEETESPLPYQGTRRRLLMAALENYRELLEGGHDDPQMRAELDRVKARIEAMLADEAAARESWRVFLLLFLPVRAELGLFPDQYEQVQQFFRARGLEPGIASEGLRTAYADPNVREQFRSALSDSKARHDLLRLLNASQQKRLTELFLQFLGPLAFNSPEVVEALALTPEQRQQIRALLPAGQSGLGRIFSLSGPPPNRSTEGPDKPADAIAKLTERFVALLTPEQRGAWSRLKGEPFDFRW